MKITLPRVAPRNSVARLAHQRHAGLHGPTRGARRQKDARTLRRELERLTAKEHPPHP